MTRTNAHPNILEILDGAPLPASKVDLEQYAEGHDASEEVLDMIRAMPDWHYKTVRQINVAAGMIEDLPGTDNGFWHERGGPSSSETGRRLAERLRGLGRL